MISRPFPRSVVVSVAMALGLCASRHFHCHCTVQAQPSPSWPELVLDETVLRTSWIAANLSALAYEENPGQWAVDTPITFDPSSMNTTSSTTTSATTLTTPFSHPDYPYINFYTEEPDQAIVAQGDDGRCYIAFRGTNSNIDDWLQNAGLGDANIYRDFNSSIDYSNSTEFCEARGGFADFLLTAVVAQGRADVEACVEGCKAGSVVDDPEDCLVITGHSQGGAVATLAAITLYSLAPTVVTFGQPPSIDPDCPYIDNTRFYRFVNWLPDEGQSNDIGFDLVVYAPTWVSGSVHYGYNILVGPDATNVYYGGYGDDVLFEPSRFDNKAAAHTMSGTDYSYQARVAALYKTITASDGNVTIGVTGSIVGTPCEPGYKELCLSNSCVENKCIPLGGVTETCIKESCEEDSDCAGDLVCIYDACAQGDGQVEDGCPCRFSSQCDNKDCITLDFVKLDFVCNTNSSSSAVTATPVFGKTATFTKNPSSIVGTAVTWFLGGFLFL